RAYGVLVFLLVVVNDSQILINVWNRGWEFPENELVLLPSLLVPLRSLGVPRRLEMQLDELFVVDAQLRLRRGGGREEDSAQHREFHGRCSFRTIRIR